MLRSGEAGILSNRLISPTKLALAQDGRPMETDHQAFRAACPENLGCRTLLRSLKSAA
jgi:hypothetical protein